MSDLVGYLKTVLQSDFGDREVRPVYVPDGDCLVYYASDEPCHAHRVDTLVTVYLSDSDPERIVGCQIKGVEKVLRRFGSFGVEIGKRPRSLGFLFMAAGMDPQGSDVARDLYDSELASTPVDLSELCLTP